MKQPLTSKWASILTLLVVTGCANMATGEYDGQRSSLITQEEIEQAGMETVTAFELVQRLRPRWLQRGTPRSVGLSTLIAVYQDDSRLGGPDEMRLIPVSDVIEIRYLDSAQAGRLPGIGSDHVEAAIVVVTQRGA